MSLCSTYGVYMTEKLMDFSGIVTLDKNLVDQVYQYLEAKESELSKKILHAVHIQQQLQAPSIHAPSTLSTAKLSDVVEFISKHIRQVVKNPAEASVNRKEWSSVVEMVNKAFWSYLEILEDIVRELFQQLDRICLIDWNESLFHVIEAVKEMLMHCLDDLHWALKRVEAQLKEYQWICEGVESSFKMQVKKKLLFWFPVLDNSLMTNVEKVEKYLVFHFQQFSERYKRFRDSMKKIEDSLEKFLSYQIFSQFDLQHRDKIKRTYQYMKFWEMNEKTKILPQPDLVLALQSYITPQKSTSLFREYYSGLFQALFAKSDEIKNVPLENTNWKNLQEELKGYLAEVHTLSVIVGKYRGFLNKNTSGTDFKKPSGVTDWLMGSEGAETKALLNMTYDLQKLAELYQGFIQAVQRKGVLLDTPILQVDEDVAKILHELNQPLISRTMMRLHAERLMILLEQLDELSTGNKETVNYIQHVLLKVMRSDWRYQVLFDIPAFSHVYLIHHNLMRPHDDRLHLNRIHKFKRLIHQIEQWISHDDISRHLHDIELDINDLKIYMQDFLKHVQRMSAETENKTIIQDRISRCLLEYRHLFGKFFHHLRDGKPQVQNLRRQFLFVDQYFEAVETALSL